MNPWVYLVCAGFFEVDFTTFLKLSDNFTQWKYSALFIISAIISFSLLGEAMKEISIGASYAVWTGIGAVGTSLIGMIFFGDPVTIGRIFFLALIIGGVVGMKFISHTS